MRLRVVGQDSSISLVRRVMVPISSSRSGFLRFCDLARGIDFGLKTCIGALCLDLVIAGWRIEVLPWFWFQLRGSSDFDVVSLSVKDVHLDIETIRRLGVKENSVHLDVHV